MRMRVVQGDFDGYLGGWVFTGKIDLRGLFASDAAPPNGMNIVAYADDEVDRLFAQLSDADSWDAMTPLLQRVQREIAADQPYSFLYEAKRVAAYSTEIGGVRIDVPSDPLHHLADYWRRG